MCPPEPETGGAPQRLFFALWPDQATRQRLAHYCKWLIRSKNQSLRGRPVPADNLHITLAFLGNIDARQRACVELIAASIREDVSCPTFELRLDQSGHWSRSRVLWLRPSETPESLARLAGRLQSGARQCGLSLDIRPYRPHLTVARKVSMGRFSKDKVSKDRISKDKDPQSVENMCAERLRWAVSSFVLVRSIPLPQGVRYEVLREWQLKG